MRPSPCSLLLVVLSACSVGRDVPGPQPWAKTAPAPTHELAVAPTGDDICMRALACCRSFAWSIAEQQPNAGFDPEAVCAPIAQALDRPDMNEQLCATIHEALLSATRQLELPTGCRS